MKRIYFPIVVLGILVFLISFRAVQTYFSDNESHKNDITVGDNKVEIVENFTTPEPSVLEEFTKDIKLKNTGDTESFVRLYIGFSNKDVANLAQITVDGTNYYSFSELKNHLPLNWVYINDTDTLLGGYFYYTQKLAPGETSSSITKKFKIDFETSDKKNEIAPDGFDINVYAESVQVYDKDGVEFTGANAYRNAWTEFLSNKQS